MTRAASSTPSGRLDQPHRRQLEAARRRSVPPPGAAARRRGGRRKSFEVGRAAAHRSRARARGRGGPRSGRRAGPGSGRRRKTPGAGHGAARRPGRPGLRRGRPAAARPIGIAIALIVKSRRARSASTGSRGDLGQGAGVCVGLGAGGGDVDLVPVERTVAVPKRSCSRLWPRGVWRAPRRRPRRRGRGRLSGRGRAEGRGPRRRPGRPGPCSGVADGRQLRVGARSSSARLSGGICGHLVAFPYHDRLSGWPTSRQQATTTGLPQTGGARSARPAAARAAAGACASSPRPGSRSPPSSAVQRLGDARFQHLPLRADQRNLSRARSTGRRAVRNATPQPDWGPHTGRCRSSSTTCWARRSPGSPIRSST